MKNLTYIAVAVSLLFAGETLLSADTAKDNTKGYVKGSLESTANYYVDDPATKATVPDGRFGANNYLKVDYYNNKFSAGAQMEAYTPVLLGIYDSCIVIVQCQMTRNLETLWLEVLQFLVGAYCLVILFHTLIELCLDIYEALISGFQFHSLFYVFLQ